MSAKKLIILSILMILAAPCLCLAEYNAATGQNEVLLISDEAEMNMGRNISRQVEKEFEVILDPTLDERLDRVGEKLVSVCDRKDISYRFTVIKDKKHEIVNAFCLPGGYIYVFKELLDKISSDDELAAVLGHEIGHTAARHTVKRLQAGVGLGALKAIMGVTGAIRDGKSAQLADIAMIELLMSYSREDELLADKLAIKYMKTAGYNPNGVITFLEKLQKINREEPIRPKNYIRSHPYLDDRIRQARREVTGKITLKDYMNDGTNLP